MAILSDSQMKVLRAIRSGKSVKRSKLTQRWIVVDEKGFTVSIPTVTIDFLLRNGFVEQLGLELSITERGLAKFKTA